MTRPDTFSRICRALGALLLFALCASGLYSNLRWPALWQENVRLRDELQARATAQRQVEQAFTQFIEAQHDSSLLKAFNKTFRTR